MALKDFFSNPVKTFSESLIKGAGDIISKFKADPTKVVELEQDLQKFTINAALESEKLAAHLEEIASQERQNEDNQVSERWKSDMGSDNTLSKITRPIVVLSLLGFLYVIIVTDSIDKLPFNVKNGYIDLMSSLLLTTIVAYFGSRGVEKWKSMSESKNK